MRLLTTGLLSFVLVAPQTYPPAYPRPGATILLDNDTVVVWNIAWLNGQPSSLHRHIYDLTGVYYAPGSRTIIAVDGTRRPVTTKAGEIAFQRKGVTHIEEGTSDAPLRAVFIEMKQGAPYGQADMVKEVAGFSTSRTPLLDNDRVTVWAYTRPTDGAGAPHRHRYDAVVVWLEGETPQARYVPRGTMHTAEAIGPAPLATVFELK